VKSDIRTSSRTWLKVISFGAVTALAAGCASQPRAKESWTEAITPYRITIEQGNALTSEAVAQLKLGMTQDQVRYLLGTPLLTDVFHRNRWDYVFSYRRGHHDFVKERHLTVYFDHGKLTRFEGDAMPSERELIAEMDGLRSSASIDWAKGKSERAVTWHEMSS